MDRIRKSKSTDSLMGKNLKLFFGEIGLDKNKEKSRTRTPTPPEDIEKKRDVNFKRTLAFQKINDKKNMNDRLKNSAPCRNILKFGQCKIINCSFAHCLKDLIPPECVFGEWCKKQGCNSLHPGETRNEWLQKMGYETIFNKLQIISPRYFKIDCDSFKKREINDVDYEEKSKSTHNTPRENNKNTLRETKSIGGTPREINDFSNINSEKIIIIFPPHIEQQKVKKIMKTLIDVNISNIEIRRK